MTHHRHATHLPAKGLPIRERLIRRFGPELAYLTNGFVEKCYGYTRAEIHRVQVELVEERLRRVRYTMRLLGQVIRT